MNNKDIGHKVREVRKAQGTTMREFAERMGLSRGQMSRLERGKQGFRSSTLLRIAEALDVKPIYFFVEDGDENGQDKLPVYGLLAGKDLVNALRSPEFVRVIEKLADAYLHKRTAFLAMEEISETILG